MMRLDANSISTVEDPSRTHDPAVSRRAWLRATLLIGSALLGVLAYPSTSWHLVAWLSAVPVFAYAVTRSPGRAFMDGWLYGSVFFGALLRWLEQTVRTYSVIPWPITWLPVLALAAYCGLYIGLVAVGVGWLARSGGRAFALAVAPFLWIAAEWSRGHALSGFPWGLLGYSQALVPPVIQIAAWTGVYGVSFLVASVNAAIAGVVVLAPRRAAAGLAAAALLLTLDLAIGLSALGRVPVSAPALRVAIVQPSIDQARKWEPASFARTEQLYWRLTRATAGHRPDLVIWPETALPFPLREDPTALAGLVALSAEVKAPIVVGTLDGGRTRDTRRYLNSAFLVGPTGIEGRYDKIHLVPFGEYLPGSSLVSFVEKWAPFVSELQSGTAWAVFPLRETAFGVVICYEAIFPDLFRSFVLRGGRFMVNITNDAWFGDTSGPWQHLAILPLRAVENGVAIARAANTGVSAVIEPSGRIVRTLGLFERGQIDGFVTTRGDTTFYTRHGDVFALGCLGLSGIALAGPAARWRQRHQDKRAAA